MRAFWGKYGGRDSQKIASDHLVVDFFFWQGSLPVSRFTNPLNSAGLRIGRTSEVGSYC